jgi:sugar lactone lactonase YvrE
LAPNRFGMNLFRTPAAWLLLLTLPLAAHAQNVGIGTTAPNASAALEVQSTTGGLLLPRMTSAQRQDIANPAYSLLVFQTDNTPGIYYFDGTTWLNLVSGSAPGPTPTTGVVSTLAGSTRGFADGTGTAAQFWVPSAVAYDGSGNLYVADRENQRIRRVVVATGAVTTLAGSGLAGKADGPGPAAQFNAPSGVAYDGSGNLYVADLYNDRIRRIVVATGAVSTLAGSLAGFADGTGPAAQFNAPFGVACDGSGNLYVADRYNNRIRRVVVATGAVSTLAGNGTAGFADGRTLAQFNQPIGVAYDGSGNVYVADQGNQRIRRIVAATGSVTTMAGSATSTQGSADGTGAAAQFSNPVGVACDGSGNVYVADQGNQRIRVVR